MRQHPRDAAIAMSIGDADDASAVKFMQAIGGQMYAIKEQSIWRVQLADEIDPKLEYLHVPNSMQHVCFAGTNSKVVRRTLIQTISLLQGKLFSDQVSRDGALTAAFIAAHAGSILEKNAARLEKHMEDTRKVLQSHHRKSSYTLPHVTDLEIIWASSAHSINQMRSAVRNLAFAFFPECKRNDAWLSDFRSRISFAATRDFDNDQAFENIDHDPKLIREIRNIEEHPKADRQISISDYWMRSDGHIHPPTIQITGLEGGLLATQLSDFLGQFRSSLETCFEMVLLWSVGTTVKSLLGLDPFLVRIPAEEAEQYLCDYRFMVKHGEGYAYFG